MNNPIIVSFYTENTPYEIAVEKYLLPSLKKHNLKYIVSKVNNFGSWKKNTDYKPKFLCELLSQYKELIWLDVDAEIVKYPELLYSIPEKIDIAFHKLDWNKHYNNNSNKYELLSGTLFIRDSAINLVKEWSDNCNSFTWEQKCLEHYINNYKYKCYELPAEYCCVVTKENKIPEYITDPVIIHHQVSRQYKRLIK